MAKELGKNATFCETNVADEKQVTKKKLNNIFLKKQVKSAVETAVKKYGTLNGKNGLICFFFLYKML